MTRTKSVASTGCKLRVVTLGEALLRFSPGPYTRLEHTERLWVHVAGSEANVAATLAGLGVDAVWVSRVPSNFLGRLVLGQLRKHGINTRYVQMSDHGRLGTYYTNPSPIQGGYEVVYDRANSSFATFGAEDFDENILNGADVVHLTGVTAALGSGARELLIAVARAARSREVPVSIDINYRRTLWESEDAAQFFEMLIPFATVVISSLCDAKTLFGCASEPKLAVSELRERFALDVAVLTLGEDGCIIDDGSIIIQRPIIATPIVDRIGRGDAFSAGFLRGWLCDGLAAGADFGIAAAAVAQTTQGDLPQLTLKDLERLLDGNAHNVLR